ncbi:hypothetical protein B1218_35635, partial [Pseudomonas ogarae]
FIPLRGRTEIARKKGADLLAPIHPDPAPSKPAFAASLFAPSDRGATSEAARRLADSETRSDLIGWAGNVPLDDNDPRAAAVLLHRAVDMTLSARSLSFGDEQSHTHGTVEAGGVFGRGDGALAAWVGVGLMAQGVAAFAGCHARQRGDAVA